MVVTGKMVGWKTFKERVFTSGIEPSLRQKAWKYLLGFYSYDITRADRRTLRSKKKAEYARMKAQWSTLNAEQASRSATLHFVLVILHASSSN